MWYAETRRFWRRHGDAGDGSTFAAPDLRIDGPAGDIGFAIGRTWWGCGYVPEAATAVLAFAREHLGIERITGSCDRENVRIAASQAISFEIEF